MPLFITQGRYTHDAWKGMIAKPEDRAEAPLLSFGEIRHDPRRTAAPRAHAGTPQGA